MSRTDVDTRIDDALAAVIAMRASDIEAADLSLREIRELSPDATELAKLRRLRAAAVNAAQLWGACLPQLGALTYTLDGQVTAIAAKSELSVTG
jgi:hypothetical protein